MSAGFGKSSVRSLSSSLTSTAPSMSVSDAGNAVKKVGSATPASLPMTDKAAQISKISASIQTTQDMGMPKTGSSTEAPVSATQTSLRNASNDSKLECIDPNYPGTGGVEGYLQYYRLAA